MKFVTYILVGITLAMQSASAATNLTASSYNFNENDNLTGGTVLNLSERMVPILELLLVHKP